MKEYHGGRSVEEGKVSWEKREGKKYRYHGGREAVLLIVISPSCKLPLLSLVRDSKRERERAGLEEGGIAG